MSCPACRSVLQAQTFEGEDGLAYCSVDCVVWADHERRKSHRADQDIEGDAEVGS